MSHPYKTTGKIIFSLFKFLYSQVIKGKKRDFILNGKWHFMNLNFS